MSQADIARRSGLSTSQISKFYNGQSFPSVDAILSLAKALKISPEEIFRNAADITTVENTPDEDELIYRYRQLSSYFKEQLLNFLDFLLTQKEAQPAGSKIPPMSENEMVDAIKKIATRHGYSVQETDLAAIIKSSQKVKER